MRVRMWVKRHLDQITDGCQSPDTLEMTNRASAALDTSLTLSANAQAHAEEAQRLLGAIRREIAVTKARPAR